MENIYKSLCSYDKRSPDYFMDDDLYSEEEVQELLKNCSCDACYSGANALTVQLIEAIEALKAIETNNPIRPLTVVSAECFIEWAQKTAQKTITKLTT